MNYLKENNVAVELKREILLQTTRQQDVDILPASSRSVGNLFAFGKERLSNPGRNIRIERREHATSLRACVLGGVIQGRVAELGPLVMQIAWMSRAHNR